MIRPSTVLLAFFAVLPVFAAEITWKGGGDTVRWSDGSNWEGGVAPGKGDTAVIPDGKTAWSSHYTETMGGDRTLIDSLGGIRLDGADAVYELDCENDSDYKTCCFIFSTPVTGSGHFVVKNTVANDRYAALKADNTGFTGVYEITNACVKVQNTKAIVPGCRINVSGTAAQHGISLCAGVYSNEIHAIKTGGANPGIWGTTVGGVPMTTNLAPVILEKSSTSVYLGNIWCHTVSNLYDNTSSLRISGVLAIGPGGLYGRGRMVSGAAAHFYGPNSGTGGYSPFGFVESGRAYIYYHAANCICATELNKTTVDLGGYDQSNVILTGLGDATLTTEKPATLTWTGSNTSDSQTMSSVVINGPVSIVYNMGANSKTMTLNTITGTMSGAFIQKLSNVVFSPYVTLPRLKKLASVSTDKYNPSRLKVQTANLNPGRLRLEAAGEYGTIEIEDGVQLDVKSFLSAGADLAEGVYGSAAAHEAHPELVDEDHVLSTLLGTGTVKVRGR